MQRRLALVLVPALGLGVAAGTAEAAPRKITKSYTATAVVPDPSPQAPEIAVCEGPLPSQHTTAVKLPAAGKFELTMNEFIGDWDVIVRDTKTKELLGSGAELQTPDAQGEEFVAFSVKRATSIDIVACNFAGGSTAKVTYTFTYKK